MPQLLLDVNEPEEGDGSRRRLRRRQPRDGITLSSSPREPAIEEEHTPVAGSGSFYDPVEPTSSSKLPRAEKPAWLKDHDKLQFAGSHAELQNSGSLGSELSGDLPQDDPGRRRPRRQRPTIEDVPVTQSMASHTGSTPQHFGRTGSPRLGCLLEEPSNSKTPLKNNGPQMVSVPWSKSASTTEAKPPRHAPNVGTTGTSSSKSFDSRSAELDDLSAKIGSDLEFKATNQRGDGSRGSTPSVTMAPSGNSQGPELQSNNTRVNTPPVVYPSGASGGKSRPSSSNSVPPHRSSQGQVPRSTISATIAGKGNGAPQDSLVDEPTPREPPAAPSQRRATSTSVDSGEVDVLDDPVGNVQDPANESTSGAGFTAAMLQMEVNTDSDSDRGMDEVHRPSTGRVSVATTIRDPDDVQRPSTQASSMATTIRDPDEARPRSTMSERTLKESCSSSTLSSEPRRIPKERPREAIEREKERKRMLRSASERSSWRPTLAPKSRGDWNHRHQLIYTNDGLNPNYRCYFDRWLDKREDKDGPLGVLEPKWRLNPKGISASERNETLEALKPWNASAQFRREPPKPTSPEKQQQAASISPARSSRSRSSSQHSQSVSGSRHSSPAKSPKHSPPPSPSESLKHSGSPAASSSMAHASVAEAPESPKPDQWNSRHHVVWCNERTVGGKVKNPVQLRSYFDRERVPHFSRCQENSRSQPVVPSWRLQPLGRGDKSSPSSSSADPRSPPGSVSRAAITRCKKWNARHQLTFLNEEVSRLDRSYFDRWREPEALVPDGEQARSGNVRVWSLEKCGTPEQDARAVWQSSHERHAPCGKWNSRHQLFFCNHIHQNARSYFDRWRELPDPAGSRERKKLTKDELLPVSWKLQEPVAQGFSIQDTLRRCESDPGSRQARRKQKRREGWFSNHSVVF